MKCAAVIPLPGVTQDIAGYKVKRFCVLWFITLESKERLKDQFHVSFTDIVDVVTFMRSKLIARNLFLTCVILFDHRKSYGNQITMTLYYILS